MPELPEVETIKRILKPIIVGKEIIECQILYERVLPKNTATDFISQIENRRIVDLYRRGKYLLFELDLSLLLIVHLRMTGQLILYQEKSMELAKHTSAIFTFSDDSQLRFVDQRKFGTIYLLPADEIQQIAGLYHLGPEPLTKDFSPQVLTDIVQSRRPIKSILLDQRKIAGLGNIYADEALFRAKIHPQKLGISLVADEIRTLHQSIIMILQAAIRAQGTTIRDYRTGSGETGGFQDQLQVYGRTNSPCPICNALIERVKISGRSSHYCSNCQRRDLN